MSRAEVENAIAEHLIAIRDIVYGSPEASDRLVNITVTKDSVMAWQFKDKSLEEYVFNFWRNV